MHIISKEVVPGLIPASWALGDKLLEDLSTIRVSCHIGIWCKHRPWPERRVCNPNLNVGLIRMDNK